MVFPSMAKLEVGLLIDTPQRFEAYGWHVIRQC